MFQRACEAVCRHHEWAVVPRQQSGSVSDADRCPVLEVVQKGKLPHKPHVAVTSLRDGGMVEQGTVVVYRPSRSTAVWGAEYTTALDAIKSVCGCDVSWPPHAVNRPKAFLSLELTASNAEYLGEVVQSPHSDVAWLEPRRYCWIPAAAKVTSADASRQEYGATNVAVMNHASSTLTGAIRGTAPEVDIIGAAAYLLHRPPSHTVHVVYASINGAHLVRAQEAL